MATDETQDPSIQVPFVMTPEMGNAMNAAVTSHLKRLLPTAIAEAMKPLVEQIAAVKAAPPASDDGEPKKGKVTPEMAAMAKQLEDMKTAFDQQTTRASAAEKQARDDRAYATLRQQLEGKVAPGLVDMVAQNIFHVQKLVTVDDQGNATFKTTRALYPGADPTEEEFPLAAGVTEFLKGDSAKAFLPAPSAGGNTSPLPKRVNQPHAVGGTDFSRPATSDAERIQRSIERENMAKQALGHS